MDTLAARIADVRGFNRFYTNVIGVLGDGLLQTPYSLTEARVLFELAQAEDREVGGLRGVLDLDAGYLSRILSRFEGDGLITRQRSAEDARRQIIRLTAEGRAAFELLDTRSAAAVRDLLAPLSEADQRRLVGAMGAIRDVLAPSRRPQSFGLRELGPGDFGWVVQRHGELYAQEYGWDETFEGLVARIVADYIDQRDPQRESAWIAEVDSAPVGCVFCMRKDDDTAQLRLLLVDPAARGAGIGGRLIDECVRFARHKRYQRIMLWTNDVLVDARRLYERAGFVLGDQEAHHSFGRDLVGQNWWLELSD